MIYRSSVVTQVYINTGTSYATVDEITDFQNINCDTHAHHTTPHTHTPHTHTHTHKHTHIHSGVCQSLIVQELFLSNQSVEPRESQWWLGCTRQELRSLVLLRWWSSFQWGVSCTVVHGTWLATCACHEGTGWAATHLAYFSRIL